MSDEPEEGSFAPWLNDRKVINVNDAEIDVSNIDRARMRFSTFRALQRLWERIYEDHDFLEPYHLYDAVAFSTTRMECSWTVVSCTDIQPTSECDIKCTLPTGATDHPLERLIMQYTYHQDETPIHEYRYGCVAPGWRLIFDSPSALNNNRYFVIRKVTFNHLDNSITFRVDGMTGSAWNSSGECRYQIKTPGSLVYRNSVVETIDSDGRYSVDIQQTLVGPLTCTTIRYAQQLEFDEIQPWKNPEACAYCRRDFSNSVLSFKDIAGNLVAGVAADASGNGWYCMKRNIWTKTGEVDGVPQYTKSHPSNISTFTADGQCGGGCDCYATARYTETDVRKLLEKLWVSIPATVRYVEETVAGGVDKRYYYKVTGIPSILCGVGGLVAYKKYVAPLPITEHYYCLGNIIMGKHYQDSLVIMPWSEANYIYPHGDNYLLAPRLHWTSGGWSGGVFCGRSPKDYSCEGTRRHSHNAETFFATRIVDLIVRDTANNRTKIYLKQARYSRTLDDGTYLHVVSNRTDDGSDGSVSSNDFLCEFDGGGGAGFHYDDRFDRMGTTSGFTHGARSGQVRRYDDAIITQGTLVYKTQVYAAVCCDTADEPQHWYTDCWCFLKNEQADRWIWTQIFFKNGNGLDAHPSAGGFVGYAVNIITTDNAETTLAPLRYRDSVTIEGVLPIGFVKGATIQFCFSGK